MYIVHDMQGWRQLKIVGEGGGGTIKIQNHTGLSCGAVYNLKILSTNIIHLKLNFFDFILSFY